MNDLMLSPKGNFESEENKIDYSDIHINRLINLSSKPKRPPLAISIGYDDVAYNGEYYPLRFGTFGNISMIKGEEKARKSWLKSMILSCAIGGNSNLLTKEIHGHNLSDKYIIDIDTEQDEHDAWMTADRVKRMVGAMPPNYIPIALREHTPNERLGYLEWLCMESDIRKELGVISIDGYVDMLKDFNSLTESMEFTQKLMTLSSKTKAHFTGVLHLNPNSDKARGHLGTILQQKCETVVIIKDMGSYSEVTCQRGRGKKFQPFAISVNNDWLPYMLEDYEIVERDNKNNKANF